MDFFDVYVRESKFNRGSYGFITGFSLLGCDGMGLPMSQKFAHPPQLGKSPPPPHQIFIPPHQKSIPLNDIFQVITQ